MRICRVVFRWARISLWSVILLALLVVAQLHWNGLPDFAKKRVLRRLHDSGYDAQFARMRLGWGPSIIVDDAFFQRSGKGVEPTLQAARAELEMTLLDLAHAKIALKSLEIYDGKLQFPTAGKLHNALSLDGIHLELLYVSSNRVRLTNTMASFRGVRLDLNGELTHPEAVLDWKGFRSGRPKASGPAVLARVTDIFDHIHFSKAPRVNLDIDVDARDIDSARCHLSFVAPDVSTPWGDARKLRVEAACAHLLSTNQPIFRVDLSADETATPWAQGSGISLTAVCSKDPDLDIVATTRFSADELDGTFATNNVRTSNFRWEGTAGLNATNLHLLRAGGALRLASANSPWASAQDLQVAIHGETNDPPASIPADWGFWAKLASFRFDWTMSATNIVAPKLKLESLASSGDWRVPVAEVRHLDSKLYDGKLSGKARVDIVTREVVADAAADFDGRQVAQLLTPVARRWLSQFDWQTPPDLSAQLRMTLPAWTNRRPNWGAEIRPTLQIAGSFSAPHGGLFRGVAATEAQSHFGYTNRVWTLPDLTALRPDGAVTLSYTGSDATHDYHFLVDSTLAPNDVKALLTPAQQRWFEEVKFSTPPKVRGEVWGRWHSPELIRVNAHVEATNFVAHGENVDSFSGGLEYSNKILTLRDAGFVEGSQHATVGFAQADLTARKIELTNATGVLGPDLVRRVSAPHTPKFLREIEFDEPPTVAASGVFTIGDPLATDLRFAVQGKGFHFTNLVADSISGGVRWRARNVLLTNIQAGVYNTGSLVGWCMFDYQPRRGTDFKCNFTVRDVDLHTLAAGFSVRTNKLEGMLDGSLVMIDGNSTNQRSWNGFGSVHVHNAQLWDIKLFGIFSPILNALSPGAGDSRAYEASADYAITNGVLTTDDLVVHSTGFRLNYSGTLDGASKEIDARAEAELLRDTRVLGPLFSALFSPLSKLFEYKITGPIRNPKMSPIYIPEPFMLLLRPFHTLKTLGESAFGSNNSESTTNAVPGNK